MAKYYVGKSSPETEGDVFFFVGNEGIFFRHGSKVVERAVWRKDEAPYSGAEVDKKLFDMLDFSREDLGWSWEM